MEWLPWIRRRRREAEREQRLLELMLQLERLVPLVEAGADVIAGAYVRAGQAVPTVFLHGRQDEDAEIKYIKPGARPAGRARHRRPKRALRPA